MSTTSPPKSAATCSWLALIFSILPLVAWPIVIVLILRADFGAAIPGATVGMLVVTSLVLSLAGFILGIIALILGRKVTRSVGWIRLRAAVGIGFGFLGLASPCVLGGFGFAAAPSASPTVPMPVSTSAPAAP